MQKKDNKSVNLDVLPTLIGYHLRMAQLASYRDYNQQIGKATSTTPAQLAMLLLVDANPGISQTLLGETMAMDRASTMAIIDKLEKRGWLSRNKSTQDRRKHALYVLPRGKFILRKLRTGVARHETAITSRLDEQEKQQLLLLLQKIG